MSRHRVTGDDGPAEGETPKSGIDFLTDWSTPQASGTPTTNQAVMSLILVFMGRSSSGLKWLIKVMPTIHRPHG